MTLSGPMTVSSLDPRMSSSLRPGSTFLNTKLGRRMFLLFAGCALLPILGLALISYSSVHQELFHQAEDRLADTSKSLAMGILERLAVLDAELQIVAARLDAPSSIEKTPARSVLGEDLSSRFRSIVVNSESSRTEVVLGRSMSSPALSSEEIAHLETGRPLLKIVSEAQQSSRILLGRKSGFVGEAPLLIWGEIEPTYLWWGAGLESTLPAGNELVVLDSSRGLPMHSTLSGAQALPESTVAEISRGSHEGISWQAGDTRFLGHYRLVYLRPAFLYPSLTLVVSQPKELVTRPLASFKRAFLGVVVATLLVVMLLSLRQIRSSLIPLEKLRQGTRRVAAGDFGVSVSVETDDEFAELASSFNSMATSLERQFETLKSLNELQQSVLGALKIDRLVTTVLEQFGRVFPCEQVSVCVMNPDRARSGLIYHERKSPIQSAAVELIELAIPEIAAFDANRHHLVVNVSEGEPSFIPRGPRVEGLTVIAFPAFLEDELAVVVAANCRDRSVLSDRDFDAARQVTDQVAIGLVNTRLVHELDNLNWSMLSTLARAIDVRSHWTMGHTERVTQLARQIGKAMDLPKDRLDRLHRGALLHDIGKIGIRSEVLDKASSLTAEERAEIREHVRLGARIIEPIPALEPVIPIVLHHHEWFNGDGYPAGLAGNEICLEARVLAVADCYDALRSPRPYRDALGHEEVMEHIQKGSGKQFEPRIVETFVKLMEKAGQPRPTGTALPARAQSRVAS